MYKRLYDKVEQVFMDLRKIKGELWHHAYELRTTFTVIGLSHYFLLR